MRLYQVVWCIGFLVACLVLPREAQCCTMPSRSDSKPSSNITVVGVEITVTKSGKVQDLRLFSGTASLGPAAVRAIKRKKYREFAGRTVLMAVTFSSDDNAVVSVRELAVAGISGCGGTVPE